MTSSAVVLGVIGVLCSFAPHEIIKYTGTEPVGFSSLVIQISGALYLGFAMLNWMSKGIIIGGIYARPLAMGNFMHFIVGALTLGKGVKENPDLKVIWIACGMYGVFALLFGLLLFRHPLTGKQIHEVSDLAEN